MPSLRMTRFELRPSVPEDRTALEAVWRVCFGDSVHDTRLFFDRFFLRNGCAAVSSVSDGQVFGGAYALRASFCPDTGGSIPCRYIYGVGVAPEFRGFGAGAALSRAVRDAGDSPCVLVPANKGLFGFYAGLGFRPGFPQESLSVKANGKTHLNESSPTLYAEKREALLSGFGHMLFPPAHYEHFTDLGGKLFSGDGFIAAAEEHDGAFRVKELLCQPGVEKSSLLPGVAGTLGAGQLVYRHYSPTGKPFGMIYGDIPATEACFGLALD